MARTKKAENEFYLSKDSTNEYNLPPLSLLKSSTNKNNYPKEMEKQNQMNAIKLENVLKVRRYYNHLI